MNTTTTVIERLNNVWLLFNPNPLPSTFLDSVVRCFSARVAVIALAEIGQVSRLDIPVSELFGHIWSNMEQLVRQEMGEGSI